MNVSGGQYIDRSNVTNLSASNTTNTYSNSSQTTGTSQTLVNTSASYSNITGGVVTNTNESVNTQVNNNSYNTQNTN